MDFCTIQTSNRLKAAGFEQPMPQRGQVWYGLIYNTEKPVLILNVNEEKGCARDEHGNTHDFSGVQKWGVFAPAATDILKALGKNYVLWYDDIAKARMWFCGRTSALPHDTALPFGHAIPAEACALALINRKDKP